MTKTSLSRRHRENMAKYGIQDTGIAAIWLIAYLAIALSAVAVTAYPTATAKLFAPQNPGNASGATLPRAL